MPRPELAPAAPIVVPIRALRAESDPSSVHDILMVPIELTRNIVPKAIIPART